MIVAGGVPRASRTEGILESSVTHAFPALEHRKIGSQGSEKGSGTTNSDHQWPPNCLPMELSILINWSSLPIQWSQMFVTFPLVKKRGGPTSVPDRRDIEIQRHARIPCTQNKKIWCFKERETLQECLSRSIGSVKRINWSKLTISLANNWGAIGDRCWWSLTPFGSLENLIF